MRFSKIQFARAFLLSVLVSACAEDPSADVSSSAADGEELPEGLAEAIEAANALPVVRLVAGGQQLIEKSGA